MSSAGRPMLAVPLARVLRTVPDRTGAGDAFAAGFLVAHAHGAAVPAAVAAGHRRAAAHLRSLGAR
jgi:sugar/nucleoside kinase (ribokinase family)